jgi:hypothetical protein
VTDNGTIHRRMCFMKVESRSGFAFTAVAATRETRQMTGARRRDHDDSPQDDQGARPAWEDLLDDEPLMEPEGGLAMDAMVYCPYCAEAVEIVLDPGGGPHQRYVQDCEVCCQPWLVDVSWSAEGAAWVDVRADDGR